MDARNVPERVTANGPGQRPAAANALHSARQDSVPVSTAAGRSGGSRGRCNQALQGEFRKGDGPAGGTRGIEETLDSVPRVGQMAVVNSNVETAPDAVEIRPAATVIIVRDRGASPRILMGQRSRSAVFMPSKFVFPGGVVDSSDELPVLADRIDAESRRRLAAESRGPQPEAIMLAGIREVFEETGLKIGCRIHAEAPAGGGEPDAAPRQPVRDGAAAGAFAGDSWAGFMHGGVRPSAAGIQFIFRAITPPGRVRRYDTRFFLADAARIVNDPDDLSGASGELSHLSWVPLADTGSLEMPFITEVVLAELRDILEGHESGRGVPFLYHDDGRSYIRHL